MTSNADTPRAIVATALRREAVLHDSERFDRIGDAYDDVEMELLPLETSCARDIAIAIAMSFWDSWIDARNHDWHYYQGISQSDWPVLARTIASMLDTGAPITEPGVLKRFAPEYHRSLWRQLKEWLLGNA